MHSRGRLFIYTAKADRLEMTMKGSLGVIFDYCYIDLPLAHNLSLVPKSDSCQISKNRLIQITYSRLMWSRMSQSMHMMYQTTS